MKRLLMLLGLALVAAAPAGAQDPDLASAPRIPLADFKSLLDAHKVLVVDVRDAQSFAAGHIPGARSMPLDTLLEPGTLALLKSAKKPIVLYCA